MRHLTLPVKIIVGAAAVGLVLVAVSWGGLIQRADHSVVMPAEASQGGCELQNQCYLPAELVVAAGESVIWINEDGVEHTVVSDSTVGYLAGEFGGMVAPGGTFTHRFDGPSGTHPYLCMIHPWMTGVIHVVSD